MDLLWIFVAIFAAALQTFRSAFQKRMIPDIGKFGATYIRFIYALPFTFLIFSKCLTSEKPFECKPLDGTAKIKSPFLILLL